jgi:type IV secretory pathway VirB4 component
MQAVKAAIVLSAQNIMQNLNNDIPKILAIDNFSEIVNLEHYSNLFSSLSDKMTSINGVFVSTSNIDALLKLHAKKTNQTWIPKINTSFILPSEVSMAGVDKLLNLDSAEFKKLTTISSSSRMFLIKQDGHSIACELSLGGFPGITRLLCSGKEEQEIYKEIIKEVGNNKPEDWVGRLYAELENIGI